jgi:hypothetical protein
VTVPVEPATNVQGLGVVTTIPVALDAMIVVFVFDVIVPEVAEIVVDPAVTACNTPVEFMVATEVLLDVQVTAVEISADVPSE